MALSAGSVVAMHVDRLERNIWRTRISTRAHRALLLQGGQSARRRAASSSRPPCSLLHVPVDLTGEKKLDPELASWLSFARAEELSTEVKALAVAATSDTPTGPRFLEARKALATRRASPRTKSPGVRARGMGGRSGLHAEPRLAISRARAEAAHAWQPFAIFPTDHHRIVPADRRRPRGARPLLASRQDTQLRTDGNAFLKAETLKGCVEKAGVDRPRRARARRVRAQRHGGVLRRTSWKGSPSPRTAGVQSYGSRCVKPPVPVPATYQRPHPMTAGGAGRASPSRSRRGR